MNASLTEASGAKVILADERVEVQSASIIQGDITTLRIVVHEGGEVNGHVRMGNPQALEQAKAAAAARKAAQLQDESAAARTAVEQLST